MKVWNVYKGDEAKIANLSKEANISPAFASILLERGIETKEDAEIFLNPENKQPFYDPYLMNDMEKGVNRIVNAVNNGEKIAVYGDYDVDGITATSILVNTLKKLGANADFYIPDRQTEGYGLNIDALKKLASSGVNLVVTVDCGIAGIEEVKEANNFLDIIITDHHIPSESLPEAIAVINPHRSDCPYPDKNLSGVGVAFKLCQALYKRIKDEEFTDDLEFVALGTIADIVPLIGENRKLVKEGLKTIQNSNKPGIKALIEVSALAGREIGTGQVGFALAPRLNASGRIGHAKDGVSLLLSDSYETALSIAENLNDSNIERQEIEKEILREAQAKLDKLDVSKLHSIVLDGENWHPGVIGIVASRLVDTYYLPTIIISHQGDEAKGSCRSIRALHMHDALSHNAEYLLGFGGHSQAAGLTIKTSEIPKFREAFENYVASTLTEEDYAQTVELAAIMKPEDVTGSFIEELDLLEPYGMGNAKPVFGAKNLLGKNVKVIGRNSEHLSFSLGTYVNRNAIAWGKSELADIIARERIDICYTAQSDEWQGEKRIELIISSLEPAECERVHPNRDLLIKVYLFLKNLQNTGNISADAILLTSQFARAVRVHCSLFSMKESLQIFREIGLLTYADTEKKFYKLEIPKEKLDLNASSTYSLYNCYKS